VLLVDGHRGSDRIGAGGVVCAMSAEPKAISRSPTRAKY
jgi:hypothetical protein